MRRVDVLAFVALTRNPLLLLAGFYVVSVHVVGFGRTPPSRPGARWRPEARGVRRGTTFW